MKKKNLQKTKQLLILFFHFGLSGCFVWCDEMYALDFDEDWRSCYQLMRRLVHGLACM